MSDLIYLCHIKFKLSGGKIPAIMTRPNSVTSTRIIWKVFVVVFESSMKSKLSNRISLIYWNTCFTHIHKVHNGVTHNVFAKANAPYLPWRHIHVTYICYVNPTRKSGINVTFELRGTSGMMLVEIWTALLYIRVVTLYILIHSSNNTKL